MTATLDDEMADLRHTNAELQRRLEEALADRDEALQRENATAEILRVINSSAGDAQPTLDAIAASATRLCGAASGAVFRFDGSLSHLAAHYNCSPAELDALRATYPLAPTRGSVTGRAILTRAVAYVADIATDPEYALPGIIRSGMHAHLSVPMLLGGNPVGAITLARREAEPFSEAQIQLLKTFATQAVIAMENGRLLTETREALEHQTATAEVLQVINTSPGELAPVFDAMLDKATRLSEAAFGIMQVYDGKDFRTVATRNMPPALAEFLLRTPRQPTPHSAVRRILDGEDFVQFEDMTSEPAYLSGDPRQHAFVELGGTRTYVAVALRADDRLLGTIATYRQEIRFFSDKQIAFLQNFAAQAVIAMENARLITETREALDQQTATAEVLQVINSSPGDLNPVFDAMLEKAMRLCGAAFGFMTVINGEQSRTVAAHGVPAAYAAFRERNPTPANAPIASRVRKGEPFIHTVDLKAERFYEEGEPQRRAIVDLGGARTLLAVPLMRDQAVLGAIQVYRTEVRPFSDKQISLLQNFATQAVIAMENARLITETHDALDQQTATAEVLQVINSSPGDLTPVFDAMLEKAMRLCEAAFGLLFTYDGKHINAAALHNIPEGFAAFLRRGPVVPAPHTTLFRAIRERRPVQIMDVLETPQYRDGDPFAVTAVEAGGVRTVLSVPLLKDEVPVGVIGVYRQEVRSFTDKQIALLQSFAAQAVIAMENARLLTETRETLEQQTATTEVLQVINSSPGDLAPVFDAMIDRAAHLCEAAFGSLFTYDGERFQAVALRSVPPPFAKILQAPFRPDPGTAHMQLVQGEPFVHIEDVAAAVRTGPLRQALIEIGGARTLLGVPLIKDGALLGAFMIYRQEVRPFTDKQIALLQNFAAQAVIAMENARLITETREALEQQTATAEVLQVINSSPGNLAPVFDAMLERALQLCEAAFGVLWTYSEDRFLPTAHRGVPAPYAEFLAGEVPAAGPGTGRARLLAGEPFVHTTDLADEEPYRAGEPHRRAVVDLGGARTALLVPLRKDEVVIGLILIYRQEVRPFTDKQIALLKNFAAQAVIAMENARLITETREALEQQTATAEVLQVINSSPGDLAPVFDAMLEKAIRLCEAQLGLLLHHERGCFLLASSHGAPPAFVEFISRQPIQPGSDTGLARLAREQRFVHVDDLASGVAYQQGDPLRVASVDLAGMRTFLAVPLVKEGDLIGAFVIYRQEVHPFSDKQITLLENFAAQAVIAMENARLLNEIRQRQAELRTTFDNMADGVVMFDDELRLAAWNRNFQHILDLPDALLTERPSYPDYLRILAERGEFGTEDIEAELSRRLDEIHQELRLERTRPDGRIIEVRRNAVPAGGFVLIYSDITERKRSEAEIRAARDAAEAAYRDLKAAQASLIQAEKMASLGQLTAGIAHEIKNPLNFVNNFAGLSVELLDELKETATPAITALDNERRAEIDETIEMLTGNLEKIAEHGRRADNIVKSMLEHSRGSSGDRRSVDLNGLVEEALNLAYHGGRAQDQSFNVTLEQDFGDAIAPIELVPQDITRVCLNLFGNGFYAATKRQREGGDPNFKPTLKVTTRNLDNAVEVRIRDNGVGIPAEIKDKLFQPFFTTKPTGEGTGLGLSISYDIVTQQHGGTIEVDSRVEEFTEFIVRLPRTHRATMAEAAS